MMNARFTRHVVSAFCAIATLAAPAVVRASDDEEDSKIYDARLEGYSGTLTLQSSSTALMWLLLIVMGGACVGVLFKNSNRSHLD